MLAVIALRDRQGGCRSNHARAVTPRFARKLKGRDLR